MSTQHDPINVKPLNEVLLYLENLLPTNIPTTYSIKPLFKGIAEEEKIRDGVLAFKEFLRLFLNRLKSVGHLYAKPSKIPGSLTDYPFLHNITNLLVDIGYHGRMSKNGDVLSITNIPLCCSSVDNNGHKKNPKIPLSSFFECLRFLTLCGFIFTGIDLDVKMFCISETQPLKVSYPDNPVLLTGLKILSVADIECRTERRYWNDHHLLRCDYRLVMAEKTDVLDTLKDILHPLSQDVQTFALKLHRRYVSMGLTCTESWLQDVSFSYANLNKHKKDLLSRDKYQKRIWAFSYSIRHGHSLFVRAKKTEKYKNIIGNFSPSLQEIIAGGYGCYKKFGRARCMGDCQGIRLPLDDSILDYEEDITTWLDLEMPFVD